MMNSPYWGPDDSRVFFNLFDVQGSDVIASVPRLGGALRTEVDLLPLKRTSAIFQGFTALGEYVISFGSWIYVGAAPETVRWVSEDSLAGDGALLRVGSSDSDFVFKVFPSPDGRWIAYTLLGQESGLAGGVVAIDGTHKTVVTEEEHGFPPFALGWTGGGEAVYYHMGPDQGGRIVRVPFDPSEGTFSGDPTAAYTVGSMSEKIFVAGQTLVYVGGSASGNLMAIDLAGAPKATDHPTSMLTHGTAFNGWPAFTPDGDAVLFPRMTTWGEGWDLLLRPTAGGAERLITHRPGYGLAPVTMPAMSSDGRHLAFYERNEEYQTDLVVLTIATGHATEFPVAVNQMSAGWSPDGQHIATSGLDRLILVTPRDSSETLLEIECDTSCFLYGSPVYSPDGNQIVIQGLPGLWIVTLENGRGTRIVEESQQPLIWTEDGLFFIKKETAPSGARSSSIYRIPAKGGDPQLYARVPQDCEPQQEIPLQLTLSQDASMAVCVVMDLPWDVHIVENFDAGRR